MLIEAEADLLADPDSELELESLIVLEADCEVVWLLEGDLVTDSLLLRLMLCVADSDADNVCVAELETDCEREAVNVPLAVLLGVRDCVSELDCVTELDALPVTELVTEGDLDAVIDPLNDRLLVLDAAGVDEPVAVAEAVWLDVLDQDNV